MSIMCMYCIVDIANEISFPNNQLQLFFCVLSLVPWEVIVSKCAHQSATWEDEEKNRHGGFKKLHC